MALLWKPQKTVSRFCNVCRFCATRRGGFLMMINEKVCFVVNNVPYN